MDAKFKRFIRAKKMREERKKRQAKSSDRSVVKHNVKIMKVDCEGCELDALLSSHGVVKSYKPDILLEVCPFLFSRCRTTAEDEQYVWNFLLSLNYNVYLYFHERAVPKEFRHSKTIKLEYNGEYLEITDIPLKNQDDLIKVRNWMEREKEKNVCFQLLITQINMDSFRAQSVIQEEL